MKGNERAKLGLVVVKLVLCDTLLHDQKMTGFVTKKLREAAELCLEMLANDIPPDELVVLMLNEAEREEALSDNESSLFPPLDRS